MAEVLSGGHSITSLPENLLLDIFKNLPIKDLCMVGRVCRTWRRVANDNSLWRHVDLRAYRLNLKRIWKVIRAHFSDVLLTLQLRGNLDPGLATSWKKPSLSDAMLKDLKERCPNLRHLGLTYTDLSGVSITSLPNSVSHLSMIHSMVPPAWFKPLTDDPELLPGLLEVNMTQSTRTCNSHLKDLAARPSICCLKLNACYRVTEDGLKTIIENLKSLQTLEISQSGCTDLNLHQLARKQKNLQRLDIRNCTWITDDGLGALISGCKDLVGLYTAGCNNITEVGLAQIKKLQKLRYSDDKEHPKVICKLVYGRQF